MSFESFRAINRELTKHRRRERESVISQIVVPTVRKMRRDGFNQREIAELLNFEGFTTASGQDWTQGTVGHLLKRCCP